MANKLTKKKAEAVKWQERLGKTLPLRGGMRVARDSLMRCADLDLVERVRIRQRQYNAQTNGKWAEYHRQWTDAKIRALHRLPEQVERAATVNSHPAPDELPSRHCCDHGAGPTLLASQTGNLEGTVTGEPKSPALWAFVVGLSPPSLHDGGPAGSESEENAQPSQPVCQRR